MLGERAVGMPRKVRAAAGEDRGQRGEHGTDRGKRAALLGVEGEHVRAAVGGLCNETLARPSLRDLAPGRCLGAGGGSVGKVVAQGVPIENAVRREAARHDPLLGGGVVRGRLLVAVRCGTSTDHEGWDYEQQVRHRREQEHEANPKRVLASESEL